MPTVAQIHGMLLEEAVLYLLRFSGYQPVTAPVNDPTLRAGTAGLEVQGRGEHHQIDAIADFTVPQPFVNPGRLLIEAKFKDSAAGIEIVRNAVGVLKDVSEYWTAPANGAPGAIQGSHPRYHYQYALLAASGFTANAQRYAAAHDVYLIPFERAGFFRPVMDAIRACVPADGAGDRRRSVRLGLRLSELRQRVRGSLAANHDLPIADIADDILVERLSNVITAVRGIQFALLAVAVRRVPLVLTPAPGVNVDNLGGTVPVRIYWDSSSWYLRRVIAGNQEENLFSFDVPDALLALYIEQHELSPLRALDLKQQSLGEIQALLVRSGNTRVIRFVLDGEWLKQAKTRLAQER